MVSWTYKFSLHYKQSLFKSSIYVAQRKFFLKFDMTFFLIIFNLLIMMCRLLRIYVIKIFLLTCDYGPLFSYLTIPSRWWQWERHQHRHVAYRRWTPLLPQRYAPAARLSGIRWLVGMEKIVPLEHLLFGPFGENCTVGWCL